MPPPRSDQSFVRMPDAEFEAILTRAADELGLLPENSAVARMMGDYAAMREQARARQP